MLLAGRLATINSHRPGQAWVNHQIQTLSSLAGIRDSYWRVSGLRVCVIFNLAFRHKGEVVKR